MSIHRSPNRLLPRPAGRVAPRAVAGLTAVALAWTGAGCAAHRWKRVPINEPSVASGGLAANRVRLLTDSGPVTLTVRHVAFPFIDGQAQIAQGSGLVALDLRHVRSAWSTQRVADATSRFRRLPLGESDAPLLAEQQVQFVMDVGNTALNVERVEFPYVIGRPARCLVIDRQATADYDVKTTKGASCSGWVSVDLRHAQRLEVQETERLATIGLGAGIVFAALLAVVLVALLVAGPAASPSTRNGARVSR